MTLIEKYNRAPVKLTRIGLPVIQKYIRDYMKGDLLTFMPLVILVVIITFFLNFRNLRGVLLPAVSVLLGTFWTLGIMGLFHIPITLVVNMLPPLLVAVGSSYSIHIFNQYMLDQEEIEKDGKRAGIINSLSHISITVMLAALTTFAGFMTLTVNQVTSLRDFGIFAAFGTLLAMLLSSALIPSALVLLKLLPAKKKLKKRKNLPVLKVLDLFNTLAQKYAKQVVIIFFLLIAVFSYGITKIRVETSPLFQFKKDSYIYKSDIRVGQLFNGSALVNLVIDSGRANGVKDPEFLKLTEEIREWITQKENRENYLFLHTLSFGDIIKRMHKAMNKENPEYYSIPEKKSTIEDYLELYSGEDRNSDGRVDSFEQFVDPRYRYANILIRVGSLKDKLFSTAINARGQERVREYLSNHPVAKKYRWHFVGETINFTVLSNLVVRGQVLSVILTLVIVSLVVFFLFKNWQVGLVSLIPISTSIILVYGIMGYFNIPLDIPKALLAAIAIGIGVDDTIHMLKTIRHNLLEGLSIEESIRMSYREAGMAIVYTSLALVFGFSVLLLSEFIPIFYLGWLVASTMIATTVSALLLLPAVIILFKIPIYRESNSRVFKYINFNRLFQPNN
jgi:predicted RND superfamily exporter protein